MTTPNLANAVRAPGRLVLGPSQAGLTQAYPHGGTGLGYVSRAELRAENDADVEVFSEIAGGRVAILRGEVRYTLVCELEEFDWSVIGKGPFLSDGGTKLRESEESGGWFAWQESTLPILFAPLNTTAHHAIYIYNPSIHIVRGFQNSLSGRRSTTIRIDACFNSGTLVTNRAIQIALLSDMNLTN